MYSYAISSKADVSELIDKYHPDFILYRDKENINYHVEALKFVKLCLEVKNLNCFLHQDVNLAKKLGATGVHLTSSQFEKIEYAKSLNLEVIISTHSFEEVQIAKDKGADYVTYSPIFSSPNKGKPKGIDNLKTLLQKTDMKIFALGGIVEQKEVDLIKKSGIYGFASIRYFI